MAGKNFWVICIDYQPKIYEGAWGKNIQDKTKGSQFYRGFTSRIDAEAALNKLRDLDIEHVPAKVRQNVEEKENNLQNGQVIVFTDGSFKNGTGKQAAGWGYYGKYKKNDEINPLEDHGNVKGKGAKQVNGEITAALNAVQDAIDLGLQKVDLYCDFWNLMLWDCGFYESKKEVSKDFVKQMKDLESQIEVHFHWSPGHTGIPYNEKADELAKRGFDEA